jgi:hypothetical protein
VILFLLLCIVSVLAGLGVLAALGLKMDRGHAWLFAPGVCLTCWALALGIGVSLGIPVRLLAVPFWVATAAACAFGAWRARGTLTREVAEPLLIAAALPMVVLVFDFLQGVGNYIGGPAMDGWSHVAFGQYLWEMTKGAQGHFAPLYQYATHLNRVRFIATALLAVISPLAGEPGDTQAAAGYFVAWSLFVFGASCAFVARANGLRRPWLLAFCALAVMSRWVVGAVQIHNYDNLIAISFLPMAMGMAQALPRPDWRGAVTFGGVLAAAICTYPEMAAFVIFGGALSIARRASAEAQLTARGAWLAVAAGGAAVAMLLLLPSSSDLLWFFSNQLGAATSAAGTRAGEGNFPELLRLRDWGPAFWGLSSHGADVTAGHGWQLVRQALGLTVWVLACAGLISTARRRQWDILAIAAVLTAGALFMVVKEQYSYGAYKFVLLGWWSIAWLVVAGARALAGRSSASFGFISPRPFRIVALCAVVLVVAGMLGSVVARIVLFHRVLTAVSIEPYRRVLEIERVVGSQPVIVAVDDDLANQWAVYFLRRHSIRLIGYRGYMAMSHVVPVMDQAAPVDVGAARYVLSDAQPPTHEAAWSNGPYTLWRIPPTGTAFLRDVANPNGLNRVNGRSFFWIGRSDTELDVVATSAGEAALVGRFVLGPSLPDRRGRRLLIGSIPGAERTFTIGEDDFRSLPVPVRAGDNHIHIRLLDQPDLMVTVAGDTRALLVGVEGLSVSLGPSQTVRDSSGLQTPQ